MKVERGDFLNPETKEIKAELMIKLMRCMEDFYGASVGKLNGQETIDITFSCLIMFARETLFHLLMATEQPLTHVENMLVGFSKALTETLVERLKDAMANPTGEVH